jgi:hypothetical protein
MKNKNSLYSTRLYTTLFTFLVGNVISYPIKWATPLSKFDLVIPGEEDEEELTTEMYMIRILIVSLLVLAGGFFAGK